MGKRWSAFLLHCAPIKETKDLTFRKKLLDFEQKIPYIDELTQSKLIEREGARVTFAGI